MVFDVAHKQWQVERAVYAIERWENGAPLLLPNAWLPQYGRPPSWEKGALQRAEWQPLPDGCTWEARRLQYYKLLSLQREMKNLMP